MHAILPTRQNNKQATAAPEPQGSGTAGGTFVLLTMHTINRLKPSAVANGQNEEKKG